jgi:hypothetical protein
MQQLTSFMAKENKSMPHGNAHASHPQQIQLRLAKPQAS